MHKRLPTQVHVAATHLHSLDYRLEKVDCCLCIDNVALQVFGIPLKMWGIQTYTASRKQEYTAGCSTCPHCLELQDAEVRDTFKNDVGDESTGLAPLQLASILHDHITHLYAVVQTAGIPYTTSENNELSLMSLCGWDQKFWWLGFACPSVCEGI